MIVLDTNVVSEVMRPQPEARVVAWLRAQPIQELATTTITLAEIGVGLARLPESRRRFALEGRFHSFVSRGLGPRVFGFDADAAAAYGEMVAGRERRGRPFQGFDGLIAAVALARDATIATRNVRHFEGCGLRIVNPWNVPPSTGPEAGAAEEEEP